MSSDPLKFRWHVLMGISAAMFIAEVYHIGIRTPLPIKGDDKPVIHSTGQADDFAHSTQLVTEFVIPAGACDQAVLVVGNLGSAFDGDLDVVIRATREFSESAPEHQPSLRAVVTPEVSFRRGAINHATWRLPGGSMRVAVLTSGDTELFSRQSISGDSERDDSRLDSRDLDRMFEPQERSEVGRVYFIQANRSVYRSTSPQVPIQCFVARENSRVRIFVDENAVGTNGLVELIDALDVASLSRLGNIVEDLVGQVSDIDDDGRLAIVITSAIDNLGTVAAPVKGLTRSSDFTPGLERPWSNQSDVVFLSPRLQPGDELNAVLAHEWCHAAVFSRRTSGHRIDSAVGSDDDWLNEAMAHVVEVRATNCWDNISHRIIDFASRPESSPLVVRDYYHSEFWRHNGCRGAAYLFLQWCVDQAGDSVLEKLLSGRGCTTENLELAMGQPFSELFRRWTESLGLRVANQLDGFDEVSDTHIPHPDSWDLLECDSGSRTIHVRGVSAAYLLLKLSDARHTEVAWRLSIETTNSSQLQAALLPVRSRSADVDSP